MEKMYYAHTGGIAAGSDRMVREAAAMQNTVQAKTSGGPLPSLAEQLARLDDLRSRVGALAERVLGPRSYGEGQVKTPTAYGGILGALEGETVTLRQRIDEMHADLAAIESALS